MYSQKWSRREALNSQSQSGHGFIPLPWWHMSLLKACRPLVWRYPKSSAVSHRCRHPTFLSISATTGYITSHFSNNIVRSSLLSFSLTSHIETAPSSLRKQSVKAVPTPLPSHNVRAPELQTPQIAPLCACAQQELPKELCLVCLSAFNN